MRSISGILKDRAELTFLSGLQDQRAVLKRIQDQTDRGTRKIEAGENGVPQAIPEPGTPATGTSGLDDVGDGIQNRCRVINHYHYGDTAKTEPAPAQPVVVVEPPAPRPSPIYSNRIWPWLLLVLLLTALALGGLAWYLFNRPWPKIPTEAADTTIGLS
jgi:hypothetical protein